MYEKSTEGWTKHLDFIVLDMLGLQIAFCAAYSYISRHGIANSYGTSLYRNMAAMLVLIDFVVMFFCKTFSGVLKRGFYREFVQTLKHAVMVELLAVLYLFNLRSGECGSRITLYLTGILYVAVTYFIRIIWKHILSKKMEVGNNKHSLIIITTSGIAPEVLANIRANNFELYNITGLVIADYDRTGSSIDGVPVVASLETVSDYICKTWVDEVFINLESQFQLPQSLIHLLAQTGVTLHVNMAKTSEIWGKKQMVDKLGNYTVLTSSLNFTTSNQAFMKRALDIIGGFTGCILTGIIYIFIAPAIYIQSPGPIFFSQTRVGKNGKKFKMYKFRSMYMDAEERKKELMKDNRIEGGMMFKVDFDPRIIGNQILPDGTRKTGIGEFIRRTSLDEFPQFWNVLTGTMTLVGTRPILVEEQKLYREHHRARLAVKPGITGMWQVSGRSDITDFEEVVRLDTEYIENWSMGLDIRILFKTVGVVLKREGSM